MEKIYGMHKLVGLQLFLSGTPTFSSGTPTFCQMGVLNSCFQNPSESSVSPLFRQLLGLQDSLQELEQVITSLICMLQSPLFCQLLGLQDSFQELEQVLQFVTQISWTNTYMYNAVHS